MVVLGRGHFGNDLEVVCHGNRDGRWADVGKQPIVKSLAVADAVPGGVPLSHKKLANFHPVEIARITDSLSYHQGAEIISSLDDTLAADTLEEIEIDRQTDIIEDIPEERARAAPFIKWVGGKTTLLAELLRHVPRRLRRYHEPFVGGGALFFAVAPRRAILSDNNGELVHCYLQVRDDVHGVLDVLGRHVYEKAHYQSIRALDPLHLSPSARAARFIYLNKTCFNGLWRVNRAGRFNVPIGRYTNPRFHDPCALLAASQALKGVEILHAPFEAALVKAAPGDFVYLDPPYDPVSATSSFASSPSRTLNGWSMKARL